MYICIYAASNSKLYSADVFLVMDIQDKVILSFDTFRNGDRCPAFNFLREDLITIVIGNDDCCSHDIFFP